MKIKRVSWLNHIDRFTKQKIVWQLSRKAQIWKFETLFEDQLDKDIEACSYKLEITRHRNQL